MHSEKALAHLVPGADVIYHSSRTPLTLSSKEIGVYFSGLNCQIQTQDPG